MSARWMIAALLGFLPGALRAQEADVNLTPVRPKTDLTEEDRGLIRTFLNQRIARAIGTDPVAARKATDELRAAFDGSDAFKRDFANAALEQIAANYKKAELLPATRLLTLATTFNLVESQNLFLEALQDERVGVRAAGALGLRALRPKLAAAGRDTFVKVLDALKDAAKREKSRDTLKAIYAALNYFELPTVPDAKANASAVLDLLEARARQYASGNVAALGADDAGLRLIQTAQKNLDDNERQRAIVVAATLTRYAIEQYTSPATSLSEVEDDYASRDLIETRNALERLILAGEDLLVALLKPDKSPAVAESMRKLDTEAMQSEWLKKWVPLLQKAVNQDFSLKEPTSGAASGEGA